MFYQRAGEALYRIALTAKKDREALAPVWGNKSFPMLLWEMLQQ